MWNENERLLQDYSSLRNIMACVCAVWILVPAMCACVCVCRYPLILGIYYMLGMYSLRSRGVCDLCLLEILMFPVHLSLRSVKEIRKGQRGMTAVCNGHLSLSLSLQPKCSVLIEKTTTSYPKNWTQEKAKIGCWAFSSYTLFLLRDSYKNTSHKTQNGLSSEVFLPVISLFCL